MSISEYTIKAIIREYHGIELTDDEIKLIRPGLEIYESEIERLNALDLSEVFSARLLRAEEI